MQKGQEFSSFKELEPALNELRMYTTILSKFSTVKLFEIRTEDTRSLRVFWNQLMRSGSTPTWVTGRNKLCVCVCECAFMRDEWVGGGRGGSLISIPTTCFGSSQVNQLNSWSYSVLRVARTKEIIDHLYSGIHSYVFEQMCCKLGVTLDTSSRY